MRDCELQYYRSSAHEVIRKASVNFQKCEVHLHVEKTVSAVKLHQEQLPTQI
jgi:hypothetical protein